MAEGACGACRWLLNHQAATQQPALTGALASQFLKAVELTGREFSEAVDWVARGWLPGRRPVAESLAARHSVHPSGKIILLLEVRGVGWSGAERDVGPVGWEATRWSGRSLPLLFALR